MWKQISIFLLEKKSFFAMDLIWGSEKIIKFGADLIWRSEKKIKFGADLIWQFLPFCANCAKFSPHQNLSE